MLLESVITPKDVYTYPPDAHFFGRYMGSFAANWQKSFLTALGEFEDNLDKYREDQWFVFILSAIFNIILLMNLIIAIISETYERVSSTRVESTYKEKVQNMCMMFDTIFGMKSKTIQDPNERIFVAKAMQKSEDNYK